MRREEIKRSLVVSLTLAALALPALEAGGEPSAIPSKSLSPAAGKPETTALLVVSTNDPLRFFASDGRTHLEYDLVFTNVFNQPVTLTSIDVLAPDGRTLLRLAGDALKAQTKPVFGGEPASVVPVAGSLAAILDVAVSPDQVPPRLRHRISYDLAPGPLDALIGSRVIDGPDLAVDARSPVVLAPPVRGPGWLNANACCSPDSPHRAGRLIVDGQHWRKFEMFALDIVKLRDGRIFDGDGTRNEQWYGFGEDLLAVADGTVLWARDGMPEETPNKPVKNVHEPKDFAGNSVVIAIAPGVFAAYAHMKTGSVAVAVGDRVRAGQRIGALGNTGNTTAPHLHFQLSDGPQILTSNSLPFAFATYTLDGDVDLEKLGPAFTQPKPPPLTVNGPPRPQTNTLPLVFTVFDLP